MQLPRPPQISTDPHVNVAAMQWANILLVALERILNGTDTSSIQAASATNADQLDGIDSTGFLQLAVASPRRVAFGTATLTWPGATSLSNVLTVAHGLAATPTVAFGIARDDQGGDISAVAIDGAPDSTNVKFRANSRISPTNPSSTTLYWLAIA